MPTNPASCSSPVPLRSTATAQLVGGLGVSGDGVEQDDYVTPAAPRDTSRPTNMRADQILLRGVRLPYWKFPRNPEQ